MTGSCIKEWNRSEACLWAYIAFLKKPLSDGSAEVGFSCPVILQDPPGQLVLASDKNKPSPRSFMVSSQVGSIISADGSLDADITAKTSNADGAMKKLTSLEERVGI